jgi:hypothetical protein
MYIPIMLTGIQVVERKQIGQTRHRWYDAERVRRKEQQAGQTKEAARR